MAAGPLACFPLVRGRWAPPSRGPSSRLLNSRAPRRFTRQVALRCRAVGELLIGFLDEHKRPTINPPDKQRGREWHPELKLVVLFRNSL